MSLLDTGARYQPCVVYPEIMVIDSDGNKFTRPIPETVEVLDEETEEMVTIPNPNAIKAIARFQVANQSGTSARRSEQDNEGFESEKVYRVRFPRSFTKKYGILGAQSQLKWRGVTWVLFGDATVYESSPNTARVDYQIKRF